MILSRATVNPFSFYQKLGRVFTRNILSGEVPNKPRRQVEFADYLQEEIHHLENEGMTRHEHIYHNIGNGRLATVGATSKEILNFTSNDYLCLNKHPEVVKAAQHALETHGAGLSSVRFICGTQDIHKELEAKLAAFHHQDDCVLYPSGYNANVGLFEAFLTSNDAIICDEGNHGSILDGTRFSKAKVYLYKHRDLQDLSDVLEVAKSDGADLKLVVTQGAFSNTSDVAQLKDIGQVCHEGHAMLAIDDSHGIGVLGAHAKGTPEFFGVLDKVHIINSTFSNALGGGGGGYTAGMKEVIELIRQKARPYLFSNTLCPAAVQTAAKALELIEHSKVDIRALFDNTKMFRTKMRDAGFNVRGRDLPNCPVVIGDHRVAQEIGQEMYRNDILVQPLFAPYVPNNQALIRVNMNAGHTPKDIERCVDAFIELGKAHNLLTHNHH